MRKSKLFLLIVSLTPALFLSFSALAQAGAHLHLPFGCSAVCLPLSVFVREEHLPGGQELTLPPLQDGDILLTDCAHTFGWRHGHAALVINSEQQLVLEAITLGTPSAVRSAGYWKYYPKITVLRLSNADAAQRQQHGDRSGHH